MDVMIDRAAMILRRGGIVAYPTDTLYGLAVDPRSPEAVEKLFRVKERDPRHPIPLIAGDLAQVAVAAIMTPIAQRLAEVFWPGPLSVVLPSTPVIAPLVKSLDDSVAIRIPASETARALAHAFGFPITSTSANLSGEPAMADPIEVALTLDYRIDFLLDRGMAPGGAPSTIVDARGPAARLVRPGAVPWERVLESLE